MQVIVDYAAIIGLRKLQPGEQSNFNVRNVGVLLFFISSFISATAFVFFDANTPREYTEAAFPWISLLFVCIGIFANIHQIARFFELKENVENTLEYCK